MKILCETHGEVQATPNKNLDAFCPACYRGRLHKTMARLGVSEDLMKGPTTYATSIFGARMAEAITGQVPRDEYVKANLAAEVRKHRGKKRLRKKKAKRALRMRWGFLQMGRLLSRRVNYSEIGRRLFSVEPLPYPVIPIYGKDIDITDVVTGGEK